MVNNTWFDEPFESSPYMAILRGLGQKQTLELAKAAWSAGITLIEVPVQRPEDLTTLAALAADGERHGHQVGAGTILTTDQLQAVKEVGASFIVSPGLDQQLIQAAFDAGIPALPGVATATEVGQALSLGLTWLKAFPAISLGATWIKQMHGPFPQARFIATGGMNLHNAQEFLTAGAHGVAIGTAVQELAGNARPHDR